MRRIPFDFLAVFVIRNNDKTFSLTQNSVLTMNLNNLVSFSPSDNNLFCWAFVINVFINEVLSIHSLSINLVVLSFNRSFACRQNNYTFKSPSHQHYCLMNRNVKFISLHQCVYFMYSYFSLVLCKNYIYSIYYM